MEKILHGKITVWKSYYIKKELFRKKATYIEDYIKQKLHKDGTPNKRLHKKKTI